MLAIVLKNTYIYIIQTRPETVHSNDGDNLEINNFILDKKGEQILTGVAVGDRISNGKVKILKDKTDMKATDTI